MQRRTELPSTVTRPVLAMCFSSSAKQLQGRPYRFDSTKTLSATAFGDFSKLDPIGSSGMNGCPCREVDSSNDLREWQLHSEDKDDKVCLSLTVDFKRLR